MMWCEHIHVCDHSDFAMKVPFHQLEICHIRHCCSTHPAKAQCQRQHHGVGSSASWRNPDFDVGRVSTKPLSPMVKNSDDIWFYDCFIRCLGIHAGHGPWHSKLVVHDSKRFWRKRSLNPKLFQWYHDSLLLHSHGIAWKKLSSIMFYPLVTRISVQPGLFLWGPCALVLF